MYNVFDLNQQCTKINDVIFCTLNITNINVSKRREKGGEGRKKVPGQIVNIYKYTNSMILHYPFSIWKLRLETSE